MSYIIVRHNKGPKNEISYSYFNGDISTTLWSDAFESLIDRAYKFEEGDDYDNARDCVSQMTKEGLDVFIEKIPTAEQPKSAVLKMVNPNRYSSKYAKHVEIRIELMLDSVPGAWHQPEDFMKWVCQHNYVQTVELIGNVEHKEPSAWIIVRTHRNTGKETRSYYNGNYYFATFDGMFETDMKEGIIVYGNENEARRVCYHLIDEHGLNCEVEEFKGFGEQP